MSIFGPSTIELLRAQEQGRRDYFKWAEIGDALRAHGDYPASPFGFFDDDRGDAWKIGWDGAHANERAIARRLGLKLPTSGECRVG